MLIFDGDILNATVGNLSKYTEHAITGAAVNSKGQSNFTSATIIRTNEDGKYIMLNTYRKSSIKPPSQISPLPLIGPPPPFQEKNINKPLPSLNYSSLVNDRL